MIIMGTNYYAVKKPNAKNVDGYRFVEGEFS